jgi:ABC-2 type transport system permease protein
VARRELGSYFNSPVAYIAVLFFLVLTSAWLFYGQRFFAGDAATLRGFFATWPLVFIVLLPALTMRSWAEEQRQGTAEILLTLPVRERELVLGKFLAAWALLGLMFLLTLPVPLGASLFGSFDPGPIASQYLGALLLGASGLALGLLVSALSANQVSAFLIGVALLLVLTLIGRLPALLSLPAWASGALNALSLDYHFDSFRKGLFDSRDAVYFLVLAAGFLVFASRALYLRRFGQAGSRGKLRELLLLGLLTACLAFVLADSARFFVRLDLTSRRAYSLSPVTRAQFARIPERVRITYYLSDALRSLSPEPGRVVDLLQEYAAGSRGKVSVAVRDPLKDGSLDTARRLGVMPQQVQVVQANEQRTLDVFSGITLEYLNRYTTFPAVFSDEGLEYSLSFAIRKLLAGRRLVVGVLVGRPGRSYERDYESLRTGLDRDFWLREFMPGDRVPPEVDALLVLGGLRFTAAELRPIQRYLLEGGKVLFAVKGLEVHTRRTLEAEAAGPSALLDLLASYGVRVRREMVLDTEARDYRLPQVVSGGIAWESLGHYPPWVSIRSPGVSHTHPITAGFTGLDLLWPSPLELTAVPGLHAEVLAQSSPSSWIMKEPFVLDPYRVPQSGGEAIGRHVLAVALSGAFPGGYAASGGQAGQSGAAQAAGAPPARGLPTRAVVVGDEDFATELMQFSDSLHNVLFIENAMLWLTGNEDLLSIKARAPEAGRLDRIADPQLRRRLMLAVELANVAGIPLLVVLFAALRLARRRREEA